MLVVLGEAEQEPVVLAAERDRGRLGVVGLEHFDRAPRVLGPRRDDPGRAGGLEPESQLARAERETHSRAAHVAAAPLAAQRIAQTVHPRRRRRQGIGLPIFAGATRELRRRHQNELALCVRQPRSERRRVREVRQDHRRCRQIFLVRPGTVPEHRALERSHARRDEIDVRIPAPPAPPCPVLLVARGDAPARVGVNEPVVGPLQIGRAGEPRTERIEQFVCQVLGLGAVHADRPDAFDDRVVALKGLRRNAERSGGDEQGAGEKQGRSHGTVGSNVWCGQLQRAVRISRMDRGCGTGRSLAHGRYRPQLTACLDRSTSRRRSVPPLPRYPVMPRLHRHVGLRMGLPVVALVAGAFSAPAQAATANTGTTRMLRSPTESATQIAFAYAGNIWVVPRAGGSAVRLTSFPGDAMNPYFSPDGKWIAFSGNYGGNTDVYVMPAEGGEPKRLTWHPAPDLVQGWTPDGKSIVFSSSRSSNLPSPMPRWFTVPPAGGLVTAMPMYRAYQGKISPDGRYIAYRMNNSWDEERRNYRGGQNRPIWILDAKTLDVVDTIPRPNSKEMDPVWVGNSTVYFLSDRDGVSNVWSYDMASKQVKQITTFSDFDVKTLDAGPNALVFEQGGYVHELDPASGNEHIVPITAVGDFAWMMPQWKEVSRYITDIALSPTGKRAAIEARGEIFTVPAEKGDVRNLTQSDSSAERDPAWSPDGKLVSYFSDKSGEYQLVIASADGSAPARTIPLEHPTHYYTPSWAPDGKHIVFQDTNLRLWVVDVATGKATDIGGDEWMLPERSLNPTWSPDSRWIAYVRRLKSLYRAIFVYDMQTGQTHQITDGLADATWPAWDASGKYLWFFASTDLALGSGWLDMSSYGHTETKALYLAVLSKNDPSPLLPESDEDTGVPQEQTPGQ